jgi:hypothetical protein
VVWTGLALSPTAELTLTVTGPAAVGLGMFNMGIYTALIDEEFGGTQYGASVEPITNSRVRTDPDTLRVTIRRGTAVTGMRASLLLPVEKANYALQVIQQVLDVPVSIVASSATNYEGLNVFGLVSASIVYPEPNMALLNTTVKGMF